MKPAVRDAIIGGLAKGWPRDKTPKLDADAEKAIAALLPKLSPDARGQMLGLASRWGVKGLDAFVAELARDFLAAAADESKPEAARIDAARQLIDLRKADPQAARDVIALVTAKTPPELASGLIGAVARSDSPEVGTALVDAMGPMTPAARRASVLALLGKTDWTGALVGGIEEGKVPMSLLSLDQSQALAAHPDRTIAERAKALLAKGGGLPDPDREKVIQALAPIVLKGGDASRGKEVFKKECAKCHTHSGEGGKVGPDLTGMAAHPEERADRPHPRPEPIGRGELPPVHRLDHRRPRPERPARRRDEDLGRPARRRGEEADDPPRGHRGARRRRRSRSCPRGSRRRSRPRGWPTSCSSSRRRGSTCRSTSARSRRSPRPRGCLSSPGRTVGRLVFEDWGPKIVDGVPFALVDPQGDRVPNAVMLHGPSGTIPPKMPKSVSLPVNATARAIHLLSGVAGLGFPAGREGTVSMIVRIHYEDGSTEDHELKNGVALRRRQRRAGRPGLEAGVQARRPAGPLPDRRAREEGDDRQHRAGERAATGPPRSSWRRRSKASSDGIVPSVCPVIRSTEVRFAPKREVHR